MTGNNNAKYLMIKMCKQLLGIIGLEIYIYNKLQSNQNLKSQKLYNSTGKGKIKKVLKKRAWRNLKKSKSFSNLCFLFANVLLKRKIYRRDFS